MVVALRLRGIEMGLFDSLMGMIQQQQPQQQPVQIGNMGAFAGNQQPKNPQLPQGAFEQAKMMYPGIDWSNVAYKESYGKAPKEGGYKLESYPIGEEGDVTSPRPKEFPLNKQGIEVFDKTLRPQDLAGDVASHLMTTDPTMKGLYSKFESTMETPKSKAMLKNLYEEDKERGEKRDFETWKEKTGIPSYLRGYAFDQWSLKEQEKDYSSEQKNILDQMKSYLKTPKR